MGNEISKKYEMAEEPSASGGLSCLWKIYSAKERAGGSPVSVHVLKKEDLKDLDKARREQVFELLRRELKNLMLVSTAGRPHPGVLRHIETFEENRSILAFVTERVSCSLADAIGEGSGSLPPQVSSATRRTFERYETARGLFGLVEGLQFVHTIKRRLHLNLAPEAIFIAPSGQWKLGGFGFSVDLPSDGASTTPCPYFQTGARSGFEGAWRLHPVMAFSSPEATAPAGSSDVSCASDLFSLGCLMYELCRDDPRGGRLVKADATPQAHQTFCSTLNYPGAVNVNPLFGEVQTLVASLLQINPSVRPVLGNVTINPVFHGTEVTVLKTIDGIPGRNPAEAATFLTSIRAAVGGFPLRVQRDCIMHPLLDACAADETGRLWGSALPIVTDVCDRLDRKEIVTNVQTKFRPALQAMQLEALNSLVRAMPLYLKKMEVTFFRSDVVPMVCRALQAAGHPQVPDTLKKAVDVQEAALKAVTEEAFHTTVDGRTRELDILPRICLLVVKGTAPRVKVNALLCLSKTFHFYQVRAVVDKILPTLKFAAERDQTVAIQLCVLGCYEAVSKRLQRLGPVATHILPACTPILACQGLNSNQFDMVVGIVQGMMRTVIEYRKNEIANPKAHAIDTSRPTHPGGVPDEEEITRRRSAALGTWKPAPAAPTKLESKPISATGFPASPTAAPPAAAAATGSAPGGFGMDDIFSSLPAPAASGGSPTPSAGVLTPTRAGKPAPVSGSMGNSSIGGNTGGLFAGPAGNANMFDGLLVSNQPNSNGKPTGGVNGSSDPFVSAGLADAFGAASPMQGMDSGTGGGGMSWMSDAFGGGGGTGGIGGDGGSSGLGAGVGSPTQPAQTNRARSAPSYGELDGGVNTQNTLSSMLGGIRPPPPAAPTRSSPPPSGSVTTGGDPFSAFFDAAISGGAGARGGIGQVSSNNARASAGGFSGGFSAEPSQSLGAAPSGYGAAPMEGMASAGGGGTLEDQLTNTQREIAQLTQQLTTSAEGGMTGAAAAMGQGAGAGWGMSAVGKVASGGVGNMVAQQLLHNGGIASGPTQNRPGQSASQDPFAFLDSSSQGSQQGGAQGGGNSGFDFLGRH